MTIAKPNFEIRATVVRCRCGLKDFEPDHVCPKGKKQNLLLAYYNNNPIKNLFFNLLIKLQERRRSR